MYRLLFLVMFVAAASAWAQDPAAEEDVVETASETEAEEFEGLSAEELADLDLDDQADHTEEDDDVFKPTDVVSFQQSVNCPVDI